MPLDRYCIILYISTDDHWWFWYLGLFLSKYALMYITVNQELMWKVKKLTSWTVCYIFSIFPSSSLIDKFTDKTHEKFIPILKTTRLSMIGWKIMTILLNPISEISMSFAQKTEWCRKKWDAANKGSKILSKVYIVIHTFEISIKLFAEWYIKWL